MACWHRAVVIPSIAAHFYSASLLGYSKRFLGSSYGTTYERTASLFNPYRGGRDESPGLCCVFQSTCSPQLLQWLSEKALECHTRALYFLRSYLALRVDIALHDFYHRTSFMSVAHFATSRVRSAAHRALHAARCTPRFAPQASLSVSCATRICLTRTHKRSTAVYSSVEMACWRRTVMTGLWPRQKRPPLRDHFCRHLNWP